MEKEKVCEKTVLDYDQYKSLRRMLLSENKTERDLGLAILSSIDEKKCLPFIMFMALEFSHMPEYTPKRVLWLMYGKLKSLNAINTIIDLKTNYIANPFRYSNPKDIERLVDPKVLNGRFDMSTKQYLDRIMERMSVTQVIDAIIIQEDPERFFPLESDIQQFIKTYLLKMHYADEYKLDIPGFKLVFNIQEAIKNRLNDDTNKRGD